MADALVIQPDTKFIRDVVRSGGGDVKKCFQCATCSVVCLLSPDDAPFPRKQMLETQWGLKDKLLCDPAIWLCHNCGDCTAHCPRGARPGDVFGALRREAIKHFGWPRLAGRVVNDPRALPLLVLLPVLLFAIQWGWGPEAVSTKAGELEYANEFPLPWLEGLFFTLSGLAVLGFILGVSRFVKALRASGANAPILSNLFPVLRDVLAHRSFAECAAEKNRYWGHLLTMWGFAGLAFVGTVIGMGVMAGLIHTPLAQTNPLKLFANLSAVVILAGVFLLLAERIRYPVKRAASTYFDWCFILLLLGIVLTGFISQVLREFQASIMYPVYFVHLVMIFMLFGYAPYSKLAHLVYRTVALAAVKRGRR
jgi:quinone-modifying oxidoreductase subunit QmoC